MLDLTKLRLLARHSQLSVITNPKDENGMYEVCNAIRSFCEELDALSNVELFKALKTDKEINTCLSITLSMGVTILLSISFDGDKEAIREPIKSIVNRVMTFLDDDAVRRLRVLE